MKAHALNSEFLDVLQRETFDYFVHEANPLNGLIADKTQAGSPASIAAVGLALSSYPVGVERGFMRREDAITRTLATLRFFHGSVQGADADATGHKGFYYHFLDMVSAKHVWTCELSKANFQIKGRRYIFLKNVDHLTLEEKEALSRLEAQNLDTIQAMQIRMNLQQLFAMDAKTTRRFLDRWNAWVQVCDLGPMKRLAKTIMAKAEGILRSIDTGLSNGLLEAINGNVH